MLALYQRVAKNHPPKACNKFKKWAETASELLSKWGTYSHELQMLSMEKQSALSTGLVGENRLQD